MHSEKESNLRLLFIIKIEMVLVKVISLCPILSLSRLMRVSSYSLGLLPVLGGKIPASIPSEGLPCAGNFCLRCPIDEGALMCTQCVSYQDVASTPPLLVPSVMDLFSHSGICC